MADITCHVSVEGQAIVATFGDYVVRLEADQAQILSQALSLAVATLQIRSDFKALSIKVPIISREYPEV